MHKECSYITRSIEIAYRYCIISSHHLRRGNTMLEFETEAKG